MSLIPDSTPGWETLPGLFPSAGAKIPSFKSGRGKPSVLSAGDMNKLVDSCNAFLGLQVKFSEAQPDVSGNYTASAKLVTGKDNSILEILLPPSALSSSGGGGGSGNFTAGSGAPTGTPASGTYYFRTDTSQLYKYTSSWAVVWTSPPPIVEKMTVVSYSTGADTVNVLRADGSTTIDVALPWGLRNAQKPSDATAQLSTTYSSGDIIFAGQPNGGTGVGGVVWQEISCTKVWHVKIVYQNSDCATKHRFVAATPEIDGA
jgi:hypothetical protein